MKSLRPVLFVLTMLLGSGGYGHAVRLKGQAVTWADFSFVNSVATSFTHVYFATTEGIIRYNKIEEHWEDPLTGAAGLDDVDVRRVSVDVFGDRLYAETATGVSEYDELLDRWYPVAEVPALDNQARHVEPPKILLSPPGYVYWADGRLEDRIDREFLVVDVVDDRSGTWWMGLWGLGAARVRETSGVIDLMPYGLLQNRVDALLQHDGLLWMSGAVFYDHRTGISVFDPEANQFRHIESGLFAGFPADDINCLEADDSALYIGTAYGLLVMDKKTGQVTHSISARNGLIDDHVISLEIIGDAIYVGTTGGLSALIAADSVAYIRPGEFANTAIYDLERVEATLWIASGQGAYRLKLPSGRLQRFRDPDLALFGDVYDIERSGRDLWLLSDDGLVRLDLETGESEPFWLGAERIRPRALAVNDTIVAVGSDKGLTIIFYGHPKQIRREFTTSDGLVSNNVLSLVADGDYLWIGSDRGLTRFLWRNPDRVD